MLWDYRMGDTMLIEAIESLSWITTELRGRLTSLGRTPGVRPPGPVGTLGVPAVAQVTRM
jgi:hypothetical protein